MPSDLLAGRLRGFGSTIFAEMTRLAERTGAINLGQGFPTEDGPAFLLAAAREAILSGANQYPPCPGLPELRAAVAGQRLVDQGTPYDPGSEVVITTGATEALAAALIALCEPGDEVVVFEPYYDSYAACVAMAGGRRVPVLLRPDGGRFGFDPDELRAAISPRTRLLLLNSPHNPTGKVFTREELHLLAALCREHDLIAVTDEVYEHLTYDGARHETLAALPGMRERTLVISSAGKSFNVTGWKVGWACGPEPLVTAVRTAKQFLTFAGGTPFQAAVAAVLPDRHAWLAELRSGLARRRDLLVDRLAAAGVTTYACEGTYFLQLDSRSLGYPDGERLCADLAEQAGVVAIPSVAFYDREHAGRSLVRLAFCKREELLEDAAGRLAGFAAATLATRKG
ncbi:MAG TPA: pyridoxal phosphate-dependent aminotransferase [Nonomuraea sp.]|uniref:pyridoxal phosphate-dependent aminotransferase n=1 Tax=Nonomuraea sp. NPDC049649 TaxID=3155776 RepID=UPI002C307388|nr:pyridoxal phosphate-dependent aminotransferase [Nonomuraea sp.]